MQEVVLNKIVEKPISGEWGEEGNLVKVLRTTNFNNDGTLNLESVVTRDILVDKVEKKKLFKGDIIIEKSGGSPNQPVGRVVFFDIEGEYLCNNFTSVLRPKQNKVFPKYLHYVLFANHKYGVVNGFQNKTTGIINLQLQRYIDNLAIPLPPLETQKRIAEILDQADTLRKTTQQLINEYDKLTQSIFLDMFGDPVTNPKGWDTDTLDHLCKKITDGEHGTVERLESGRLYLMARNIGHNGIEMEEVSYISEDDHKKIYKRCNPEFGDLLLVCVGATIGRCCLVPNESEFSLARSVALIKPKSKMLNSSFILHQFKHGHFQHQIMNRRNTSAQAGLYTGQIRKLIVAKPPIELQNQFAEKIQSIEQQKALAQQSLKQSDDLFNALLQKAFKGELVK